MGDASNGDFLQVGLFLLLTIGAGCIADPLFADGELEDSWEHMDEMREISSLLETETDADLEKAPAKAAAHKAPAKAAAHKVTSFVPHFKSKKQVLKEQAKMKARYEKANKLYAKVSKKKYEAQGNKQKELNKKAEKAHQAMLKAKALPRGITAPRASGSPTTTATVARVNSNGMTMGGPPLRLPLSKMERTVASISSAAAAVASVLASVAAVVALPTTGERRSQRLAQRPSRRRSKATAFSRPASRSRPPSRRPPRLSRRLLSQSSQRRHSRRRRVR